MRREVVCLKCGKKMIAKNKSKQYCEKCIVIRKKEIFEQWKKENREHYLNYLKEYKKNKKKEQEANKKNMI